MPSPPPSRKSRLPKRFWLQTATILTLAAATLITLTLWLHNQSEHQATIQLKQLEFLAAQARWQDLQKQADGWLAIRPNDSRGKILLGIAQLELKQFANACLTLESIPTPDPAFGRAQTLLGQLAIQQANAAKAESHFRAAAARDPSAVYPRQRLIYLCSLQQRRAEVRELLWNLYQLQPQNQPRILIDIILDLWAHDDDVRALTPELQKLVAATPDNPYLRRAWGMLLHFQGRPADALDHLEFAAAHLLDDPIGVLALVEVRLALGKGPVSVDLLGKKPANPTQAALWSVTRARIEEALGQTNAAVQSLRQAIRENPEDDEAHHRLAQLLARLGANDEAARENQSFINIRNREADVRHTFDELKKQGFKADPQLFESLASKCAAANLDREAKAWLELALKLDPNRSSAKNALRSLETNPPAPLPIAMPNPTIRDIPKTLPTIPATIQTLAQSVIQLEDIAQKTGLAFTYQSGASAELVLADTMGGGVALLDYDRDGWIDVYFINGAQLPIDPQNPPKPNRLFRNLGNGSFQDVTDRAGVPGRGYGMGAAVGDYDRDGFPDLFITGLGDTTLYRNRGDGTFEDVTEAAGVHSNLWSTAAAFADLDNDQDLDLVVITYVSADPRTDKPCRDYAGGTIHCSPGRYIAQPDLLFRNDGNGRFTNVSQASGIATPTEGRGLGLAIAHLDDDNQLDLFIANDACPDFLFRNAGNLQFDETAANAGVAFNGAGLATGSMGVVAQDLDGDHEIDLFITNFLNEPNSLFRGLGNGLFADVGFAAGIAAPSRAVTGFGNAALDFDNDGRLDLFITNGSTDDQPWINSPMRQRPLLHKNLGDGRFSVENIQDQPWAQPTVGRGLAAGDLDNDGRVDLVLVRRDQPAQLLKNNTPGGHWLTLELHPRKSTNPPVGARAVVHSAGDSQTRWVTAGTGYLSNHDPRLFFGLGDKPTVDQIQIHWPSGQVQTIEKTNANQILKITEPE